MLVSWHYVNLVIISLCISIYSSALPFPCSEQVVQLRNTWLTPHIPTCCVFKVVSLVVCLCGLKREGQQTQAPSDPLISLPYYSASPCLAPLSVYLHSLSAPSHSSPSSSPSSTPCSHPAHLFFFVPVSLSKLSSRGLIPACPSLLSFPSLVCPCLVSFP